MAESFDAWRIIPRIMLALYGILVFNLYLWFRSIPTYVQTQCDSATLRILIDTGISMEDAKSIACSVLDVVGGPTVAQSAFVTTIIGLSTGIFGLYVSTGRKWERTDLGDHTVSTPKVIETPPSSTPLPDPPRGPWGNS